MGRAVDRLHVVLECKTCGDATLKRISVVLDDNPECGNCIRKRREAAAAKVGASLLGPDPEGDRHYGTYQFACGHVDRRQHLRVEDAAEGGHDLSCETCTTAQRASEAAERGWTLIGPAARNDQSYRRYEHECGHKQDVGIGNMRARDVNCAGCGETWTSKPSKIYLFSLMLPNVPVIKLGYSNNPKFRLRQVQFDPSETRGKLVQEITTETGHDAICLEKAMHRHIKTHRPDLIVERVHFDEHLRTTSEIYHERGRALILALIDAVDNGWDPNLSDDWHQFTSLRDTDS
ncbi:MAG: GIY-YIG nuclease family protein [Aliishimia sp.]